MFRYKISDEIGYTSRSHEVVRVKELGERSVTMTNSWGFGLEEVLVTLLTEGEVYVLEYRGFNDIAGMINVDSGEYLFRRTDQYFEDRHQAFVDDLNAKRQKDYDENHEDWQRRQDALPEDLRTRLEKFHEDTAFKLDGWPYELIVCELAAVMRTKDEDAIKKFSSKHGVSGNQYGFAEALAAKQNVPSALKPLGATW